MRTKTSHALPASQERSRQTRDRLLDAVELVLARDGIDGATVPAIAEKAQVAVGSVYRRFPDKDALLRGVYERFFARSIAVNRVSLAPGMFEGMNAADVVAQLVDGMVRGYRLKRSLLRALLLYEMSHADVAFRRHAMQLRSEVFRMIGDLLAARATELRHPEPREAVTFAITIARLTLQGLLIQDARGGLLDDDSLIPELTRMVSGYLGIQTTARPAQPSQ